MPWMQEWVAKFTTPFQSCFIPAGYSMPVLPAVAERFREHHRNG
jgi:hypothetical protein